MAVQIGQREVPVSDWAILKQQTSFRQSSKRAVQGIEDALKEACKKHSVEFVKYEGTTFTSSGVVPFSDSYSLSKRGALGITQYDLVLYRVPCDNRTLPSENQGQVQIALATYPRGNNYISEVVDYKCASQTLERMIAQMK